VPGPACRAPAVAKAVESKGKSRSLTAIRIKPGWVRDDNGNRGRREERAAKWVVTD